MTTLEKLQAHLCTPAKEIIPRYFAKDIAPPVICADGSTMSVQASEYHYCRPQNNEGPYTAVEVWCYGSPELFAEYGDGEDPYSCVPIELVAQEIDRRGGMQ